MGDKYIDSKKGQIKNRREKDAEQLNQGVFCEILAPEEAQNLNFRLHPGAEAGIEVGYEVKVVKAANGAFVLYGAFFTGELEDGDKKAFLEMVESLPESEAYLTAKIIEISPIDNSATIQIIERKGYNGR